MKFWLRIITLIFAAVGLVLIIVYLAVLLGFTKTPGMIDSGRFFHSPAGPAGTAGNYAWAKSEEWQALEPAIEKDAKLIEQVARVAQVDPRLIVANLMVEQLRLYTSERQIFKEIFAPLSVLGSQNQFSWGVMGMKRETAIQVEQNLKDKTSPFYPGARYEGLLNFETADPEAERYARMINPKDHYYSYLYAALYLKQVEAQWERAGFSIKDQPAVLSTLFNIGFANSKPNAKPQVGGAEIEINGTKYTFGGLAHEFYYSDKLTELFPIAQ
jgi:hypothetical protein